MAREENLIDQEALGIAVEASGWDRPIDPRTTAQLESIEEAIRQELGERQRLLAEARRHDLSVSSVAKASGVPRATMYEKRVLAEYAKARASSAADVEGRSRAESLERKLEEAEARIAALERRDGELLLARMENERLRRQLDAIRGATTRGRGGRNG